MLLGLLRQEGLAKDLLEHHGASYDAAHNLVIEMLSGYRTS
jgi:hypothetical protein